MSGDNNNMYIASVVATYWFVSINMVYLNKVLLSSNDDGVVSISTAPLFITFFQCVVTSIICWVAGLIGERFKKRASDYRAVQQEEDGSDGGDQILQVDNNQHHKPSFFAQFPKAEYKIGHGRKVFPLSIIFVGMITCNNLCLKWVEVSFYNVARSLTIVFNVILSSVMLNSHTPSMRVMGCLGIVILGFIMGSMGEMHFSIKGTIAGIFSSLFVSLNSIFTKKIMPVVDNDHWKLTFYNNVNACLLFIPLILIFEHQPIMAAFGQQLLSPLFWCAMMLAGFFGFSIGIVTVLQIKATSPLMHNISGTAKAVVQSMLAFYIWKNPATFMGVLGIFVVLGGSLLYTFVKMGENRRRPSLLESNSNINNKKPPLDLELQACPSTESTTKRRP